MTGVPGWSGAFGTSVAWLVTGRPGGFSTGPWSTLNVSSAVGDDPVAVRANRDRVRSALGGRALAAIRAEHGARVAVVGADGGGDVEGVDGLVTREPGIVLLAMGADCVPGILADAEAGVVGVFHCGWRGLVEGIVGATVAAMTGLGATTGGIIAIVGPAICGGCYGVPVSRRDLVLEVAPEAAGSSRDGQPSVDVRRGAIAQLAGLGIEARPVAGCTHESAELYSYRRDGRTGRNGAAVVLRP